MIVQVKLFAAARQRAGTDLYAVELPAGATVSDLRRALAEQIPTLADLLNDASFALDAEYATDDAPIGEHVEIACIPPVSGG